MKTNDIIAAVIRALRTSYTQTLVGRTEIVMQLAFTGGPEMATEANIRQVQNALA